MAPPTPDRKERLNVRIAREELDMLEALAERAGLTSSDVVRMLVRDEYRAKFGEQKPRPKKTK